MASLFVSFSIAVAVTAFFAFRWGWRRPALLFGYFLFFFVAEWVAEATLLPPDALGLEVGYACLGVAGLLAVAAFVISKLDEKFDQ